MSLDSDTVSKSDLSLNAVQKTEVLKDVRKDRVKRPGTRPKTVHVMLDDLPDRKSEKNDEPDLAKYPRPSMLKQQSCNNFSASITNALKKRFEEQSISNSFDENRTRFASTERLNLIEMPDMKKSDDVPDGGNVRPGDIIKEIREQRALYNSSSAFKVNSPNLNKTPAESKPEKQEEKSKTFEMQAMKKELVLVAKEVKQIEECLGNLKSHLALVMTQFREITTSEK